MALRDLWRTELHGTLIGREISFCDAEANILWAALFINPTTSQGASLVRTAIERFEDEIIRNPSAYSRDDREGIQFLIDRAIARIAQWWDRPGSPPRPLPDADQRHAFALKEKSRQEYYAKHIAS